MVRSVTERSASLAGMCRFLRLAWLAPAEAVPLSPLDRASPVLACFPDERASRLSSNPCGPASRISASTIDAVITSSGSSTRGSDEIAVDRRVPLGDDRPPKLAGGCSRPISFQPVSLWISRNLFQDVGDRIGVAVLDDVPRRPICDEFRHTHGPSDNRGVPQGHCLDNRRREHIETPEQREAICVLQFVDRLSLGEEPRVLHGLAGSEVPCHAPKACPILAVSLWPDETNPACHVGSFERAQPEVWPLAGCADP